MWGARNPLLLQVLTPALHLRDSPHDTRTGVRGFLATFMMPRGWGNPNVHQLVGGGADQVPAYSDAAELTTPAQAHRGMCAIPSTRSLREADPARGAHLALYQVGLGGVPRDLLGGAALSAGVTADRTLCPPPCRTHTSVE